MLQDVYGVQIHLCTRYRSANMGKQVRSTSLYHYRQRTWTTPRTSSQNVIDHTVVCFMMYNCSRKYCENTTGASWAWFKGSWLHTYRSFAPFCVVVRNVHSSSRSCDPRSTCHINKPADYKCTEERTKSAPL